MEHSLFMQLLMDLLMGRNGGIQLANAIGVLLLIPEPTAARAVINMFSRWYLGIGLGSTSVMQPMLQFLLF